MRVPASPGVRPSSAPPAGPLDLGDPGGGGDSELRSPEPGRGDRLLTDAPSAPLRASEAAGGANLERRHSGKVDPTPRRTMRDPGPPLRRAHGSSSGPVGATVQAGDPGLSGPRQIRRSGPCTCLRLLAILPPLNRLEMSRRWSAPRRSKGWGEGSENPFTRAFRARYELGSPEVPAGSAGCHRGRA